jgi:hypothetical protein
VGQFRARLTAWLDEAVAGRDEEHTRLTLA